MAKRTGLENWCGITLSGFKSQSLAILLIEIQTFFEQNLANHARSACMKLDEAKQLIEKHTHDMVDLCPHCGAKAHIVRLWSDWHIFSNGDLEFYVIFRCVPCSKLLLKTFFFDGSSNLSGGYEPKGWGDQFPISLDIELSKQDSENIPARVFADYKEALKCKSIGANKASCSMFRRALQSSLIELGVDTGLDLVTQINSLVSLPDNLKDWAHQIRILGNWSAHPDKDNLKEIDEDNVSEVHDFVAKFFVYTFIMPQKVAASRKRREEKVNKENSGNS